MSELLIANGVWIRDTDRDSNMAANYFQCGRIVEAKILPILRQFRKKGLPIIHHGNKGPWALEIRDNEYSTDGNASLGSFMTELNPDDVYVVGFHTNRCILVLMDYLLGTYKSHIVIVEDTTLNAGELDERNVNKGYLSQLINETKEFIVSKGWETITTENLLRRLQ